MRAENLGVVAYPRVPVRQSVFKLRAADRDNKPVVELNAQLLIAGRSVDFFDGSSKLPKVVFRLFGVWTMSPILAEFIGTMFLVLLGNGVCANVNLKKTFGHDSGWLVIATGWALAVAFAVYVVNAFSGAHLNPAVSIGLAAIGAGGFSWAEVPGYVLGQMGGAIAGAVLVWLTYLAHWNETEDQGAIRGSFCNTPAIPNTVANMFTEIIGTFVLMLGVLAILTPENLVPNSGLKEGLSPALVGLMVFAVGISLGGATGYAINPARDLGPRIAHAFLPIKTKGDSGWGYSWIPVVGPIIGALLAAFFYQAFWPAAANDAIESSSVQSLQALTAFLG